MDHLGKLAFVIAQLATYAGEKRTVNSGSTLVSCPYHSEKTPSFRIFHAPTTKSPGFGKCYGCGAAHPWDAFADKLGLKPWSYAKPTEIFASSLRFTQEEDDASEDLQFFDLPRGKVWRGIKTDFLIKIGAKKCVNEYGTAFVYLPVNVLGRERGYIKARLKKVDGKPSYINSRGSWSAQSGLFLYDYVMRKKPKVIVLVEGPRDGLRLNMRRVPGISILGTQSWSSKKSRLIELSGAEHVVLATDGDCAGLAAVKLITPALKPFVRVHHFSLTGKDSPYWPYRHEDEPTKAAKAAGVDLWDPGNMPSHKLRELRSLVQALEHS
jgi:hypothetical protein